MGEIRKGPWIAWPTDQQQYGPYVECTACQAQTSGGSLERSPVGTSFISRLNNATTASAACVVRPALDDADLVEAAVEFVVRFTGRSYSEGELRERAADPKLDQDVRGSLLLLLEDLTEPARQSLIAAIRNLGAASCSHDAQFNAVWCMRTLGAGESAQRRRQRRR